MYNMPYYKEEDENTIKEFVEEHPFAFLTGSDKSGSPVATQIPIFLESKDGKKVLRGHMMKNTDHYRAFTENPKVLAVFTGANAYISGSWYSRPNTASTWNYMSVQVQGRMHFLDGSGLAEIMRKTNLHFEGNNTESPTVYDNLPNDFIQSASKMIAGFEIEVSSVEAVFKLSQDRDEKSYQNIIEKLNQGDSSSKSIAAEMSKKATILFSSETDI